jgi:hypothetical protein
VDHELDRPTGRSPAQVRVSDDATVDTLARDEAGIAGPASLDEVEPGVLVERMVVIRVLGSVKQRRDRADVRFSDTTFDIDLRHVHDPTAHPLLVRRGAGSSAL